MTRTALLAGVAASLFFAGTTLAEAPKPGTPPAEKTPAPPKSAQPTPPPKTDKEKAAKPDTKQTAAKAKKVTYSCDGGVSMVVTYPPEAQAKTGRIKIAMKDTTYFVRPAGDEKWENKTIKLVFQPKGEEATIEREGKPLAEKCKAAKPGT
jgi:hypothetical protein